MLLLLLVACAHALQVQVWTNPSCAGMPSGVIVQPQPGACPLPPGGLPCMANPSLPGYYIIVTCNTTVDIAHLPNFGVAYAYPASSTCSGNATVVALQSGFCFQTTPASTVQYNCVADTVTNCQGTDCSSATCTSTPMPSGCTAAGPASAEIMCTSSSKKSAPSRRATSSAHFDATFVKPLLARILAANQKY